MSRSDGEFDVWLNRQHAELIDAVRQSVDSDAVLQSIKRRAEKEDRNAKEDNLHEYE